MDPNPVRYPRLDIPNWENALKKEARRLKIRTKYPRLDPATK
jgi:hypothetical protein